ncbi:MAG TPA: Hpt domain-containing protein, partial [Polyangiaceae bacterium]|nr:Hpt domain-containing protein [Polyangiaceae bacterium]
MNLEAVVRTFVAESRDLLESMERDLLAAESNAVDAETLNAIFRAAHTIKGGGGLFGFEYVVAFTHRMESVLDALRDGRIAFDAPLVALLLSSRDHIASLLDLVEAGATSQTEDVEQIGAELLEQLQAYLPPPAQPDEPAAPAPAAQAQLAAAPASPEDQRSPTAVEDAVG